MVNLITSWLDRKLGASTPNLPSRVFWCQRCNKMRGLKWLQETGICAGHWLWVRDETFLNKLRAAL